MRLTPEELFALSKIFCRGDKISAVVCEQLKIAEVTARTITGVGFFTTIHIVANMSGEIRRHWDWNFEHRHLSHGGSFMCSIGADTNLELEAVSFNGAWPAIFCPDDFTEKV